MVNEDVLRGGETEFTQYSLCSYGYSTLLLMFILRLAYKLNLTGDM